MRTKLACTAAAASILLLPVAFPNGYPQARDTGMRANQGDHLGVQSTIGDILRHPAFAGFGPLILPWDDRAYDEEMRLAYRMSATTRTIVAEESFVPASRPVLRSGGFSVIPDPRISQIEFHCVYTGTEDNEGWGLVLQRGCGSGCRLP